jgi:hypothetical protein
MAWSQGNKTGEKLEKNESFRVTDIALQFGIALYKVQV